METAADKYIREHTTAQTEALAWIQRQTNIKTNYPRMISGPAQGRFLTMIVSMLGPESVLEIGTFTGYSSVCLAMGLTGKGHVDTLEINDEMEDIIREGFSRSGLSERITLHIGDAKDILSQKLTGPYDLVFIDANKREYCRYYDLVFDMVSPGGFIIADDVLWDGKVYENPLPKDKQTTGLAEFNDRIATDPRVESVILPVRNGINLIRKKPGKI
ncbi:MAG: O-methyltransferase [Bacteroidales bacterium]|jgi:predicted O-methyltransferase YrrM|nr:O-methyltransferase [Bacteroidales bacterium]MCI1784599.1 O-methyltransferase [Bacteroidales bacterium]